MQRWAISYPYSNEELSTGGVDRDFLTSYLTRLHAILSAQEQVASVWHSMLPEEDTCIQETIWKNPDITDDMKYQAALDYCKQRILEIKTTHILFILKYPLLLCQDDNVVPRRSRGMQQELHMALGNDHMFVPSTTIRCIVAIQQGLEHYEETKIYRAGADDIIKFHTINHLYQLVYKYASRL